MSDMQVFPHVFVAGNTLPELVMVLRNTDITGYTITLNLRQPDGTDVTKTASILDAANGKFKFVWDSSDLVSGYGQPAQVRIVNGSSKELDIPQFLINVRPRIAA